MFSSGQIYYKRLWLVTRIARAKTGVSFATLNSWVNERSKPRQKALKNIEQLYLSIIGIDLIDEPTLLTAKAMAYKFKASAQSIANDQAALDKLTLHLTYHTNTIEGSTMTLADVSEVIFEDNVLSNRTAIEQAEARNHHATLHWLFDELARQGSKFAIDEALILGIHLRLMNSIISDAGQYRTHTVRIMGTRVTLANASRIPDLVTQLVQDLEESPADTIETLARTHAIFEKIHPFSDGNGRTGRLLLLAQALKAGLMPPVVVKERKHAYYKYLEVAQTKEDYAPLELFMAESMVFTGELLRASQLNTP